MAYTLTVVPALDDGTRYASRADAKSDGKRWLTETPAQDLCSVHVEPHPQGGWRVVLYKANGWLRGALKAA